MTTVDQWQYVCISILSKRSAVFFFIENIIAWCRLLNRHEQIVFDFLFPTDQHLFDTSVRSTVVNQNKKSFSFAVGERAKREVRDGTIDQQQQQQPWDTSVRTSWHQRRRSSQINGSLFFRRIYVYDQSEWLISHAIVNQNKDGRQFDRFVFLSWCDLLTQKRSFHFSIIDLRRETFEWRWRSFVFQVWSLPAPSIYLRGKAYLFFFFFCLSQFR